MSNLFDNNNNDTRKNITLINVSPPYGMEASTLKLASPHRTSSILQVLVCENEILVKDLLKAEEREQEERLRAADLREDSLDSSKEGGDNAKDTEASKNDKVSDRPDNDEKKDTNKEESSKKKKKNKGSNKTGGSKKKDTNSGEEGEKNDDDAKDENNDEKEEDDDEKKKEQEAALSEFETIELDFLKTILQSSHTVVMPDALFSEHSRIFHTQLFLDHGLDALVNDFYKQRGGTVIVLCLEGLFSVDRVLNERFGTDWKIQFMEVGTCLVEPTEAGQDLLGPFAPKTPLLKDNPHFVSCEENEEGLYKAILQSKEEFVKTFRAQDEQFEKLGIEPDMSMDCFNVEASWTKYLERYTDRYCVAVHRDKDDGGGGGTVVYYGDRGQSDTMAYVFCKLLNLEPSSSKRTHQQPEKLRLRSTGNGSTPYATTRRQVPWSLLFSGAVVVAAVLFQLYENQQK